MTNSLNSKQQNKLTRKIIISEPKIPDILIKKTCSKCEPEIPHTIYEHIVRVLYE